MFKKFIIIALILFISGSAGLGWVLSEQRKEKQLLQEQQRNLQVNLDNVHKLVAGETEVHPAVNINSGDNLQRSLNRSKQRRETIELALTGSILFMATAGAICSWLLLLSAARFFIHLKKPLRDSYTRQQETKSKEPAKNNIPKQQKDLKHTQKTRNRKGLFKKWSRVLNNSGWHNFKEAVEHKSIGDSQSGFVNHNEQNHTGIAAILKDRFNSDETLQINKQPSLCKAAKYRPAGDTDENTIKNPEPFNDTLIQLTEQVSAIREYACRQQGTMERLQDGYDWNIIRNFSLRVIHCIDNTDNRIRQFSEQDIKVSELKEVRDELLFALESSSIERFEPEIGSDYRGQEKCTEVIKDREYCDDVSLVGKIAKVIRPGYHYVINEKNFKVVRTAQVKLFGQVFKVRQEV